MQYKSYLIEDDINKINENIILFYGENIGLQNEFKDKIKKEKNIDIISFNQQEILGDTNVLFNEINNISLFVDRKYFIINMCNDKIVEVLKQVKDINNQKIFLFADTLEKKSKLRNLFEKTKSYASVPCYPDNELTIKKIVMDKLKEFKNLTNFNINIIVENSNLNRIKLNNEIEKIITYFQDKKITTEELLTLLNEKVNDNFNNLRDASLIGNKNNTNKLLAETIIEAEKNIFYLNVLNQRLNTLNELNNLDNAENLEKKINEFKPPIFWKDKPNLIAQAKKWNKVKVKSILAKSYNLEKKIKTDSNINHKILLKKFIIDICDTANS